METLAEKIHCTVDQFKDFVKFCDDNTILEKKNGRLFCPYVLERQNDYAKKAVKNKSGKSKESGESGQSEKEEKPKYPDYPDTTDNLDNPKNPRNNTTQHNTTQTPTEFPSDEVNSDVGDKRPEKKLAIPVTKGNIGDVLKDRYGFKPPEKKANGISRSWQMEAFDTATKLGIILDADNKPSWLKIFKQARELGRKTTNLDQAKSYLSDHPEWEAMDNEGRMNFFFSIYENGLKQKLL